jgi:hypothetical protein
MTARERIEALQCFGYDPQDARFLSLAALHSGYFLRRQHLSFIQGTKGWKDVALIRKLKSNRHCRIHVFRHNRMVYHLFSKPFYAALGEENNRNRREHQPSTIKNKLMGLDFVLENPAHEYLTTEHEKVAYFTLTLNIAPEDLPVRWYESSNQKATAKHFADKYPIFVAETARDRTPLAHFCYVDEGLQSTDRFATFLSQYSRLFASLSDYRVIYVAGNSRLFEAAGSTFEKFLAAQGMVPVDPKTRELLDYFEMRKRFESRDFSGLDTARIIRFRDEKKRFAGEGYETLYRQWQAGGTAAIVAVLHPGNADREQHYLRFSTHALNHDYDLFGLPESRTVRAVDENGDFRNEDGGNSDGAN